jgi:Tn3 transposase DDE domain
VLRSLNATGARNVPAGASTGFVPARWRGYFDDASAAGDVTAYRHYWELCVLLCLRDALRSGDVYVPGSRRYANPVAYLIPRDAWAGRREEFCRLVGVPADRTEAFAKVETELDAAVSELDETLAHGEGPVRLDEDGDLVIPALSAEDVPTEAAELKDELIALLPFAPLASVLIELDRRTGFLDCFAHAGGAKPRSAELKRNLIAVLIAQATNLGLARTADACGIGYDTLAWTQEWYVREETLRAANLALIHAHRVYWGWRGVDVLINDQYHLD